MTHPDLHRPLYMPDVLANAFNNGGDRPLLHQLDGGIGPLGNQASKGRLVGHRFLGAQQARAATTAQPARDGKGPRRDDGPAYDPIEVLDIKGCRRNCLFDEPKLPIFGPILQKVAVAKFTRTLGTLISSGVPILQSLNIVRETSSNIIFAEAVQAIHDSVKEGETIVGPLESSKIFPPMVVSMVDVGEQTGALPEMLMKVADNYEEEVDNAVSAMTSLLEPIMIVFLAVVVGSIVIAMFLPLIKLMDSLGGDGDSGGKGKGKGKGKGD